MKSTRQLLVQSMEAAGAHGMALPSLSASSSMIHTLLNSGQLDEEAFLTNVASGLAVPWNATPLPDAADAPELKRLVPARVALKHQLLPLQLIDEEGKPLKKIALATCDPFDLIARQAVSREVDNPVRWVMAPRKRLHTALRDFYGVGADVFDEILKGRDVDATELDQRDEANNIDADDSEDATVVKFVNQIIREALEQRATDIHVEPMEDRLRMRYRMDGRLREIPVPDNIKALQQSVLARLKVMAKLDIAERRLPQDGRISLEIGNQFIDVRVATIPSVEGESISLRLLGQEKFTLDRLRLEPDLRREVEMLLKKPNGIILITGPTGSGKSTSLYTFLSQLNTEHRRIVTIEDPVEHKLPGVVQIAVKPEIDLTFATGLRSILRGDPNVVMIGEMRDKETAEIAIRAALTGHLVFSTLHTNDALGGIMRLIDMGIEPFLVASSVRAFFAQRLVRTLCNECRLPDPTAADRLRDLGYVGPPITETLYKAKEGGCEHCRNMGYRGRMSIYELIRLTPPMTELITHRAGQKELMAQGLKDGYRPMREYGIRKVIQGLTTVEEVVSVTVADG